MNILPTIKESIEFRAELYDGEYEKEVEPYTKKYTVSDYCNTETDEKKTKKPSKIHKKREDYKKKQPVNPYIGE